MTLWFCPTQQLMPEESSQWGLSLHCQQHGSIFYFVQNMLCILVSKAAANPQLVKLMWPKQRLVPSSGRSRIWAAGFLYFASKFMPLIVIENYTFLENVPESEQFVLTSGEGSCGWELEWTWLWRFCISLIFDKCCLMKLGSCFCRQT